MTSSGLFNLLQQSLPLHAELQAPLKSPLEIKHVQLFLLLGERVTAAVFKRVKTTEATTTEALNVAR